VMLGHVKKHSIISIGLIFYLDLVLGHVKKHHMLGQVLGLNCLMKSKIDMLISRGGLIPVLHND
jgi:hypothetical protein